MSEQNFKNHGRYIMLWHFITPAIMLAILVGSIVNLIHSTPSNHYSAALIVAIAGLLFIFYWYSRVFALRTQDRAIRAEENFRHFILTGKPLDKQLRMGQIIALRFAPDEEFLALCQRAINENLSSNDIKQAIKNWRGDHHRV